MPRMDTSEDERREGDERSLEGDEDVNLTFLPAHDQPMRWLPKHGKPLCIGEWLSQNFIKSIAWWPVYVGIVTTVTLLIIIIHPWGLGR